MLQSLFHLFQVLAVVFKSISQNQKVDLIKK